MMAVSVCPSVCLSRTLTLLENAERPRKPKMGKMEAHQTDNP